MDFSLFKPPLSESGWWYHWWNYDFYLEVFVFQQRERSHAHKSWNLYIFIKWQGSNIDKCCDFGEWDNMLGWDHHEKWHCGKSKNLNEFEGQGGSWPVMRNEEAILSVEYTSARQRPDHGWRTGLWLGDHKGLWENHECQAYKLEHYMVAVGVIFMLLNECQWWGMSGLTMRMCVLAGTGSEITGGLVRLIWKLLQ